MNGEKEPIPGRGGKAPRQKRVYTGPIQDAPYQNEHALWLTQEKLTTAISPTPSGFHPYVFKVPEAILDLPPFNNKCNIITMQKHPDGAEAFCIFPKSDVRRARVKVVLAFLLKARNADGEDWGLYKLNAIEKSAPFSKLEPCGLVHPGTPYAIIRASAIKDLAASWPDRSAPPTPPPAEA